MRAVLQVFRYRLRTFDTPTGPHSRGCANVTFRVSTVSGTSDRVNAYFKVSIGLVRSFKKHISIELEPESYSML